jgi:hypothetical protein
MLDLLSDPKIWLCVIGISVLFWVAASKIIHNWILVYIFWRLF